MTEEVKIIRRKVSDAHYQVQVRWPGTEWVDLYRVIEHRGKSAPWGVHWISGATGEVSLVHRFLTKIKAMAFVDLTIAKHIELEEVGSMPAPMCGECRWLQPMGSCINPRKRDGGWEVFYKGTCRYFERRIKDKQREGV